MIKLACDTAGLCDAHADGLSRGEKCPGMCDADGCQAQGAIEVHDGLGLLKFPDGCGLEDEAHVCAEHFALITVREKTEEDG